MHFYRSRGNAKEITKMEERDSFQPEMNEGTPRWMGIAVGALAILSVVGIGMAWNAGGHAKDAEQSLAAQNRTFQQSEDSLSQRLAQAEHTNAELQSEVNLVGD